MLKSSEEPASTGVAVVNASDFLLLCLFVATAISLWKLMFRRRFGKEINQIKPKGSFQSSILRRSQSPQPPREQTALFAEFRSTIVFDEWDGLFAPFPMINLRLQCSF
jgi:hypothetical protein